jgi:glutamyl-tRNA synthetase
VAAAQIKMGELQLPLRIMLVGGKFGPPVFEIIALAGVAATTRRVTSALNGLSSN